MLFASTQSDATVTPETIRDHIEGQLAKYKRPVDITILDDLPKNAVGKIDKPAMRRLLANPRNAT